MASARKDSGSRTHIGHKKKIAFVCSGGGTKAGAFHLGVLLALQERGFRFFSGLAPKTGIAPQPGPNDISVYVGSSAGSIISSCLAAGYSLENIFNSFLSRPPIDPIDQIPKVLPKLTYQKMFKLRKGMAQEQLKQFLNLKKVATEVMRGNWEFLIEQKWLKMAGLFSTSGIEEYMREEVLPSNSFADYLPELFIVGTQLNHSKKMVFGRYNYQPPTQEESCEYVNDVTIAKACAASTALPFIYEPYVLKTGEKSLHFIDGEIRDTLSTHVAFDAGADLVIASYTHQPFHSFKGVKSLTELGLPEILIQSIYLVIEQKIKYYVRAKEEKSKAIDAVGKYCKQVGVAEDHRKRILEILEAELRHNSELHSIYIHPKPNDHEMFLREHFSLSPRKMADIVKSGFKAATEILRQYHFDGVEQP